MWRRESTCLLQGSPAKTVGVEAHFSFQDLLLVCMASTAESVLNCVALSKTFPPEDFKNNPSWGWFWGFKKYYIIITIIYNKNNTALIILCSRPLWLRRPLLGMVFINRTSIAVLCILNIDQLDNEFTLRFTGPQNPLVQMQSIRSLSKLQQEPLRTNFAGSDILYLSCSHSVLEECIWLSFSHHICHHLALTSSWRVCLCVLPGGHSLPYFCWTCCFSYTVGKNMLNRCTGRILMARLNRYGLRVFSIFWIWKKNLVRGSVIKFSKIWENFLNHFKSLQLDPAAND